MARIVARNANPGSPQRGVAAVEVWGEEPIGANQVDALHVRFGADMAGFTSPTPAGWGLQGSQERTDQTIWASPQAFTGLAGAVALSTLMPLGATAPIVYPGEASLAGIVLPGPSGV